MREYCRETWIEVNLDAVKHNLQAFRRHIPQRTNIMAVVKANGYGHGAVQVGRHALAHGADSLAVALLDEAIVLRKAGITAPVLVLGFTPVDCVKTAADWNVDLTAFQLDWLHAAHDLLDALPAAKPLGIHLKVDTGMGRIGSQSTEELLSQVRFLSESKTLQWKGIFTHFACADEADTSHVTSQHNRFQQFLTAVEESGFQLPLVHCNNSAASIAFPEWGYDTIRLGISLYGLYPSGYVKERNMIQLAPALSLKTKIAHAKQMADSLTVSYGATYTAEPGETIATLPIGYADGFPRAFSNRGAALFRGKRVPVVGRVCMDQMMISLGRDSDAQVGEEIVLYGRQGEEEISLDEIAHHLGTINYEVACMLNHRIPRVYLIDGEVVEVAHLIGEK